MAPEQIRGQQATPATDVYALGSILFEILTGEPLHPRGTAALANTLTMPQQAPSKRVPDETIAPELDLACTAALAEDPQSRPTARELGERVQRYLDGDRDTERRRALAQGELAIARIAYESADPEQRAVAIRSAGRALALDPSSVEAATLVTRMMVEPPKKMPQALVDELARTDKGDTLQRARISVAAWLSVLAIIGLLPWLSIRNWVTLVLTLGALTAATSLIWVSARRGTVTPLRVVIVCLTVCVAFTRVVGSFMMTPALTAACLFAMTANPWLLARRWAVYLWLVVATMLPLVLEALGVFRQTNNLGDGGMCVVSPMFRGQGVPDAIALIAGNFFLLFAFSNYAIATNRQIKAARHELRTQAWHLHQLLPKIT
jgi:eukaryotic-like serine/threonine-protein kinase